MLLIVCDLSVLLCFDLGLLNCLFCGFVLGFC